MQSLSLRSYRVGLNVAELENAAQGALHQADNAENLVAHLNWSSPEEIQFLKDGFSSQNDVQGFWHLWHGLQKQSQLRNKRMRAGFPELKGRRKGLRGWWQKFSDKKEIALPINVDLLGWLRSMPRLALLATLHDSLLQKTMIADPVEVDLEEMTAIPHPWAEMIQTLDAQRARRIADSLKSPLHKIKPRILIEDFMNYVIYQPNRGFAYYYA
ncbi:MAG: hypothetical protein ACOY3I_02515 [Verrucomicrobiota bacterium]